MCRRRYAARLGLELSIHTNLMPVSEKVNGFLLRFVLLLVSIFTVLMISKVIPYFDFQQGVRFLSTKTDEVLAQPVFRIGFYVHIASSCWVMAIGVVQFLPKWFHTHTRLHRRLGKVYVFSVLVLAAPSGLALALFANGGLSAKVGFSLQCVVWWLCTWQAYRGIRKGHYRQHTEWMIRSFAVTLAAMSLRVESYGMFYLLGTKPIETYLTVAWLSWTGNLLLAEVVIQYNGAVHLLSKN